VSVSVNKCSGIPEVNGRPGVLSVYPNPGSDIFVLETDDQAGIESYQVYDARGGLIRSGKMDPDKTVLDLSECDAGIYLVVASGSNNGTHHRKIIKQ
jgi:hypothetical protein